MLRLPNDGAATGPLLAEVLDDGGPSAIVRAIAEALPPLAARLSAGRLHGDPEAIVGINDSGDKQKALDVAAHDHMIAVLRDAGVIKLLTPAFDQSALDPGYIKGYLPGVRENGGQYTHAAVWTVMALALFREMPPRSEALMNVLLGTLAAMATSVVGYWVGSSVGSARKDDRLAKLGG